VVRYRFSEFTLSPQRRLLVRAGREVPLIPRYFDLLQLLIERRSEAVHRRDIFERVWADVTVSESALSQAVRTVRRALDDDSREPRFIRTVSRHGYRFVFPDVIEEEDDDTTWLTPAPGPPAAVAAVEAPRWTAIAMGAGLAGMVAGGVGGLMLAAAPESRAPIALAPVLAVIGAGCGAIGGSGVGAGLSLADKWERVPRVLALTAGGALGGGLVGVMVQWLVRWGLAALVGLDLNVGGGLVGVAIGAAAGMGVAIASGRRLPASALGLALCCGVTGLLLTLGGHPLAGGTIHAIADAAEGSRATLAPLGRLIGEPDFGPVTSAILAFGEAATFGIGVAWGLGRRRRDRSEPVSRS
jgi:DNA-binding winged helix-turn-helix (wHTH) protein